MTAAILEWQPHRLFPYERRLAAREVLALLGEAPEEVSSGLRVPMNGHSPEVFRRFTYFSYAHLPEGRRIQTDQWRLETFEHARRAQATRYSAHGLHEYKGKFNPQVVRAIGNLLKLEPGAIVFDPFCGSGTTLLECAHAGWEGVGIDLNPLAVFIANAKVAAIHAPPRRLQEAADQLTTDLRTASEKFTYERSWTNREVARLVGSDWAERLPNVEYLSRWFTPSVLAQFVLLSDAIARAAPPGLRGVFLTIMSDLVRDSSMQDPADLRIRRRKDALGNYPVVRWFVAAVTQRIVRVVAARSALGAIRGEQAAIEGDAREPVVEALRAAGMEPGAVDAVITSPPYATALPYIDTQRLSLCLLGLIDAGSIAARDRALIGSREITTRERAVLEHELDTDEHLPTAVRRLCRELLDRSSHPTSGFRRRNVPALMYRYFSDMTRTFQSVQEVLNPGAPFALVVGPNRTRLGGEDIVIDTPHLLSEIGTASGFRLDEVIQLDTFQRFDLHSRNSIRSEWLVILRRGGDRTG
jgi:site-specific DNA-methyltransferase (cytosine-N4-specific)